MSIAKSPQLLHTSYVNKKKISVVAQALAYGGEMVCNPCSGEENRKVFVSGLIPGEEAEVMVTGESAKYLRGELSSISNPSSSRRIPPCEYFDKCGGCNLQHMDIEAQRTAKVSMIASMLDKQAGLKDLPPVIDLSSEIPEFSYRLRAALHLSLDGKLGFYQTASHDVISIECCLIVEDEINKQLQKIHPFASDMAPYVDCIDIENGDSLTVVFRLRDGVRPDELLDLREVWHRFPDSLLTSRGKYFQYSGEGFHRISSWAGHFSQVNRIGNARLIQEITQRARSFKLTELYAGDGNFTFPLAEQGCSVDAVELDRALVSEGIKKTRERKLQHLISFHEMRCEQYVQKYPLRELVLMDPPREGALEVIKRADWKSVSSIIYISCNLPSLTRDLKTLVNEKNFSVEEILFIDMFPQTYHCEVMVVLKR